MQLGRHAGIQTFSLSYLFIWIRWADWMVLLLDTGFLFYYWLQSSCKETKLTVTLRQVRMTWWSYMSILFQGKKASIHLESVPFFYPNARLSAHPATLSHDSLSGWHSVLIATVHSCDAGLVLMAQPVLLWMLFLPKVTRHFNIQPLCPWLALCNAGRWIQSITSQRLYLVWGHLGLFWAVVATLCAIWVIVCIDLYTDSNYLWACVGLCLCVYWLEATFQCVSLADWTLTY